MNRIMVVDDDEQLRKLLEKRFKACGFEAISFESAVLALEAFGSVLPDLVIMDVNMPGKDGIEACRELTREYPDTPVIFLTAAGSVDDKLKGFEVGGQDYIAKPFHFEELLARIHAALRIKRARDEAVQKADNYKTLSITDPLTKLSNRRYFDIRFAEELEKSSRHGQLLACLMIDIDKFKSINDTYGHEAGDEVLKKVSSAIKSGTRTSDFAARYGGEEFVVVMTQTDLTGAIQTAERIRTAISNLDVSPLPCVTASIGVATGVTAEILTNADTALYEAKRSGRNKVIKCEK